jgi:hypothetical protein
MISFVETLRDGRERFGNPKTPKARWERAQASRLIGHWELFPFHSKDDGLSPRVGEYPWLTSCMKESISAAIRLQPELLLVMSPFGWDMLRNKAFPNQQWRDTRIGKPLTKLSYCVIRGKTRPTEIVAIRRQLLSARRICTNQDFFDAVNQLRQVDT